METNQRKLTPPILLECKAYIHASLSLSGIVSVFLTTLNPKTDPILTDRLRQVNAEVNHARALVRALHDDFNGVGGVFGSGDAATQSGTSGAESKPAQGET